MTRARARAIRFEVTSLLLEFPSSSSETWLLPKSEILCVIRYNAQDSEPRTVDEETGVNTVDSPELPAKARNIRSPDLPVDPELPAADDFDHPRRANSRFSPDPIQDVPAPGTFGLAQNFQPCLRAATWAEARVPFRHLEYIYSIPYDFLGLALV